jgi:hypothetical protein
MRALNYATAWAAACGIDGFEAAYAADRQAATDVILDHDLLARAVRAAARVGRNRKRTARRLGPAIKIANPNVLSDEWARLAPSLRTVGIDLRHHRTKARPGITIQQQ